MINPPVAPAATEYLYRKAAAAGVPLSGTFELTPVCNMDCKMCYVRLSKQSQEAVAPLSNADKWLQLAKTAADAGEQERSKKDSPWFKLICQRT